MILSNPNLDQLQRKVTVYYHVYEVILNTKVGINYT